MNSYLGRDEKNNLVRLMILKVQLEKILEIYSTIGNIDKAFLTDLRHSKTRLHKATEVRIGYLDDDARANLLQAIAKLNVMFLPTPEAKKAHKEMLELQSMMPMAVDDFQDWYEFVIETTCKSCTKSDYEACPARKFLLKYNITPVDPGAIAGKCQYNYGHAVVAGADPSQEPLIVDNLWQQIRELKEQLAEYDRLKMDINDAFHQIKELQEKNAQYIERNQELYAEIREYEKLKSEIVGILIPDGEDLSTLTDQDIITAVRDMDTTCCDLHTQMIEQVKECNTLRFQLAELRRSESSDNECIVHEDDSLPVFLGLNNGNKLEMSLPETMSKNLIAEIQRPRLSRSICARYVDGEFVAIDLREVVAMRVSGLVDADYINKPQPQPQPIQPQNTFNNEQEKYWIECKCGAEYFCTMNAGRPIARCRECSEKLFADRNVDTVVDKTDRSEATLLTNRYFVSRDPQPQQSAPASSLRDIKNTGRGYKDPCQLFG